MGILEFNTEAAILEEIGRRITRHRLAKQLTQAQLAEQAGIGKRTLERIEAGADTQLSTLLRILRVLGLLEGFDDWLAEPAVRPLDAAARQGKTRQRASGKRKQATEDEPWRWDDEP
jgi:transcriptional regulator with XRE-family HTH domain